MGESVFWVALCNRDTGLAAMEQVLEGRGQWRRCYGELYIIMRNVRE